LVLLPMSETRSEPPVWEMGLVFGGLLCGVALPTRQWHTAVGAAGAISFAGFAVAGRICVQAGDDGLEPIMIRKRLLLLLVLLVPTLAGCDLSSLFGGG
jgi:TRAP-type mannitol/chloroaromatic compound transport system permease large subunit